MRTHVPIRLVGEPEAIKLGTAVLQHSTETLEIRSIPANIPDHLTVDISALDIGDSIRVSDLPPTTAYEVLASPDTAIASVVRLRLAEVEEKPEEEEAAEGEAPAEEAAKE
jgi:large subunit ribosomal protein L25